MFEWAADLMTRYAHVEDLGKTAVQLIRDSKSITNIVQFGEKIFYKPLKLSVTMEDTFLDGNFLGMRLRSDEILVGTTRGVIKDAHTGSTRKFRCHQTDLLPYQVRSDALKRMHVTRSLGKKYGPAPGCPRMCHDWQSSPSQSLGHMQGQDAPRTGEE